MVVFVAQKTEKIKIKVKPIPLQEVSPPAVSEPLVSPDAPEPPKPDKAAAVPVAELIPTPVTTESPTTDPAVSEATKPSGAESKPGESVVGEPVVGEPVVDAEKKEETDDKAAGKPPTKPLPKNYDTKLSAPEVGQKFYVPRSRIATKNISFNKSKGKKPKYGKGSSPRNSGMSPHLSETEADGERRQLPFRQSRPQQLLDDEPVPTADEDMHSAEHDILDFPGKPLVASLYMKTELEFVWSCVLVYKRCS